MARMIALFRAGAGAGPAGRSTFHVGRKQKNKKKKRKNNYTPVNGCARTGTCWAGVGSAFRVSGE